MEKLQITGTVRRHIRRAGNTVLTVTVPTVSGDSAAAKHAEALLASLCEFAEACLAAQASEALLAAARERRLCTFRPFSLSLSLTKNEKKGAVAVTLCAALTADKAEKRITRTALWTADEQLRILRGNRPLSRKKARKNA